MSGKAPAAAGAAAAAAAGAAAAAAPGAGNGRRNAGETNNNNSNNGGGGFSSGIKSALTMFVVLQVLQAGAKYFFGDKSAPSIASQVVPAPAPADPSLSSPVQGQAGAGAGTTAGGKPQPQQQPNILPIWESGTIFDAHFYITASPYGQINFDDPTLPHTSFRGLKYGDWTWREEWHADIPLPKAVQNNGSLYLETILTRNGAPVSPTKPGFNLEDVHFSRKQLMQYQRQPRIRAVKKLLGGSEDAKEQEETEEEAREKDGAMPIVAYYHPNLTVAVVSNSGAFPQAQLNPALSQFMRILPPAEGTLNPRYLPIVFPNTFWQLKSSSYPVNETIPVLPLNIVFEPIGITKFQILASLDESFKQAAQNPGMGGGADFDELKRVLLETNPVLLATTVLVTVLHMLFELLAFKNDVSHWKDKKNQVGVSLRTIITNVVVQLIITLYLFDNSTETSWMILFSQGMGLLIEAWKITKVVDIKLIPNTVPGGLLPYKLQIKDKHVLSEEEIATKEYDALAFKYVTWGTAPLLVGYTIYSMLYESHRGWYSFVITTLTSFVYAFGFIQLIPQLIINYKLKSVAHMPMRSLIYKFLNTIVDDFFSFIIKMPTLHRLACFRDDVVFVVLLYQYYLYPVDKKRANEFGQVAAPEDAATTTTSTIPDKAEPEKEAAKAKAVKTESRKNR